MGTGFVLTFSDATFAEFFEGFGIDIHSPKYQTYGTSKAKKMRAFWTQESDDFVGEVLSAMLDVHEANSHSRGQNPSSQVLEKCRQAVARLIGESSKSGAATADAFLMKQFQLPDIQSLPIDPRVAEIIEERLDEAQRCLTAEAHLSVIFQCGSVLEAVLLGVAQKAPTTFNKSTASPKHQGKVKPFHEWSLAQFIDVAHDIEVLRLDVKTFSHGLRDFRNYIHPYQQMATGFRPDKHTAAVCLQVLKAALADVAGER